VIGVERLKVHEGNFLVLGGAGLLDHENGLSHRIFHVLARVAQIGRIISRRPLTEEAIDARDLEIDLVERVDRVGALATPARLPAVLLGSLSQLRRELLIAAVQVVESHGEVRAELAARVPVAVLRKLGEELRLRRERRRLEENALLVDADDVVPAAIELVGLASHRLGNLRQLIGFDRDLLAGIGAELGLSLGSHRQTENNKNETHSNSPRSRI
jgi:hypothetical protein